jgi:hypothetical protein
MPNTTRFENARRIDANTASKMLKADLKATFPGVKFSVRLERASMVASLNVSWTDGPTLGEVDLIADQFCGQGFDGMTDSTTYRDTLYKGEPVHFSTTSVSTSRHTSIELRQRAINALALTNPDFVGAIATERGEVDGLTYDDRDAFYRFMRCYRADGCRVIIKR